ncbi:MAG: glycosyltransferase [Planctomycetota bacterium]
MRIHEPSPSPYRTGPRELSLVVPIFNEVENLAPLHAAVVKALEALPMSWELLFVDDGSTDGSAAPDARRISAPRPARRARVPEPQRSGRRPRWPPGSTSAAAASS